ncbi:GntR family transcriptional regulator [Ectobacillus sp. SYSU M60031]|uniref:GntR family transcriptional regulator n=1 Tax=Ectobacillus ponti TaxID=2961894 RepID=A0AA41X7R8_9BACI|nr:GntR family transcriptional regulator [Ectobacillus ponti]
MIQLNPKSHAPIWEQIVAGMKELVLVEALAPGDKLPSVRELASSLLVNPNTVSKAYQELERQGVIETLRGKGTFVAAAIVPRQDEQKVQRLEQQLKQLLLEATYLGISKERMLAWVEEHFRQLGGISVAASGTDDKKD